MDLIGANIILHDVDETYMKHNNKHLWLEAKMILYIFTPLNLFMLHFIPAGHQCFLTGFQFKCKTLYFQNICTFIYFRSIAFDGQGVLNSQNSSKETNQI